MKRAIQRLNRLICGVGAVFLIPLMLLTSGEVIGRNLFNRPIAGTVELSEYLLAVFILLGVAYTQQVKGHVAVSVFVSRLSFRGQMALNVVSTLLSLFILGLLAWQGLVVGMVLVLVPLLVQRLALGAQGIGGRPPEQPL